jgi:exoribonuclease R
MIRLFQILSFNPKRKEIIMSGTIDEIVNQKMNRESEIDEKISEKKQRIKEIEREMDDVKTTNFFNVFLGFLFFVFLVFIGVNF